jgi:hypothetical protein
VAERAAERLAFMVVHAGLSLTEARQMTLREYQAVIDALTDKGQN